MNFLEKLSHLFLWLLAPAMVFFSVFSMAFSCSTAALGGSGSTCGGPDYAFTFGLIVLMISLPFGFFLALKSNLTPKEKIVSKIFYFLPIAAFVISLVIELTIGINL